jgi:hypothetical protein
MAGSELFALDAVLNELFEPRRGGVDKEGHVLVHRELEFSIG